MMKKFGIAALTAAACVYGQAALAQPAKDVWYVYGNIGANVQPTIESTVTNTTPNVGIEIDNETGFRLGGGLGYDWGFLRLDGEFYFAENGGDTMTGTAGGTTVTIDVDGSFDTFAALGNAWADFRLTDKLVPYLGGGLGYGWVDTSSDSIGTFAYQLGGGMAWHYNDRSAFTLDYRYTVLTGFEENISGLVTEFDDISNHAFLFGIRYSF